jgi:hypothetical protein
MLICRSLGTSTIVALMATHRAGFSTFDDSFPVFDQAAVRLHAATTDQQRLRSQYCSSDRLDLAFASVHQNTPE